MDKVYSIDMPNQIILDIDSTNFETYGNQYGSAYNSHYSANGYHPLLVFDGLTGDLLKAELRSGNVYTSRKTVAFIGPLLKGIQINIFVQTYTFVAIAVLLYLDFMKLQKNMMLNMQ